MALQRQILPISLGQGVDTKTDPKQVIPGKLLVLQNGVFQTAKEIRKRNGYLGFSQNILGGGSISNGAGCASYLSELDILDGTNLYSLSNATSDFVNKGSLPTTSISTSQIVRNNFQQGPADAAINGSLRAFAWADSSNSGNIRYSIVDTSTGQNLVNNAQLTSNASPVKVLAIGTSFVFIYYDSATFGSLYYRAVSTTTPTTLGGQTTIASDLDSSNFLFDAEVIGGKIVIAYGASGNKVAMYSLSSSLVKSSQYVAATSQTPRQAITVFGDASNNSWVGWGDSTNVKALIANSTLSANVLNTTTVDAITTLKNITGVVTSTTGTFYYETGPTASGYFPLYANLINQNTLTSAGVVGSPSVLNRGVGLASKAFAYNGIYYFLVVFPTTLQSTYFLMNQNALIVAKISQGLGGPENSSFPLPEVSTISAGSFLIPTMIKDQIVAFQGQPAGRGSTSNFFTNNGIQAVQINFLSTARPKLVLGNDLHIGGSMLWMYDGGSVVEHGYHVYPEGVSVTQTATGGGIGIGSSAAATNQVQYISLYEWTDNQGQLHRSAPSPAVTVPLATTTPITFTGNCGLNSSSVTFVSSTTGLVTGQVISNANFPSGTYITSISGSNLTLSKIATGTAVGTTFSVSDRSSIQIFVPTLRLTAKSNVSIVVYRTENNGTIFYRVTPPNSLTYNNKAVDSVTITDNLPDSQIIGNEQLYTTGGEVDNIAAPAINAICSYKNRAIAIPSESPTTWWYSKQTIPGSPVEFSDEFVNNVDPTGGSITAPAQMDDKLILFKTNSIFYVVGDGPTPAGTNNDFTEAQNIATDTGCNNPASVVLTPLGLMYQSPKGIYLLSRSLENMYIGAEVEAYNSFTVTSAQLIPTSNQVRFTISNGTALVYDYFFQQWSVFTNHSAVDATVFGGLYTFIGSSGLVSQESIGTFTDNSSFIALSLTLSWLSFAGIQGFQRIRRFLLLGQYKSPHSLVVTMAQNFNPTITQTVTIPVPSDPIVYQYRVHMSVQKCESMQLTLTETQSSNFGEGLSLSDLSLEVGVKQGLDKLASAVSYG